MVTARGLRNTVVVSIALGMVSFAMDRNEAGPFRLSLELPVAHASSPTGIEFFGACIESDAFVWCLDQSCSMGWAGDLQTVKVQVQETLPQLSPTHQFSLVAFSEVPNTWSPILEPATPSTVGDAIGWVETLNPIGVTCMVDGLAAALDIAATSPASCVILVGDGAEECSTPQPADVTLAAIAAINPDLIPIHAFFVSGVYAVSPIFPLIADAFGGIFVDATIPLDYFSRGDANQDGHVDISDALFVLAAGFIPGSPQPICPDAADADDNGEIEPAVDGFVLLQSFFVPGTPPLPSPANCGPDLTPDALVCVGICP